MSRLENLQEETKEAIAAFTTVSSSLQSGGVAPQAIVGALLSMLFTEHHLMMGQDTQQICSDLECLGKCTLAVHIRHHHGEAHG